jgi:hypothetical protein
VIAFLRFVGLMNGAIWLGGAFFFTFGAAPGFFSPGMRHLLGDTNFPYFSGAIAQLMLARYFTFHVTCAIIALVHLLGEWLYFGRPSRKISFSLLAILLALILAGGAVVGPKVAALHRTRYATNVSAAERQAATASFWKWHAVSQVINLVLIGGLAIYLWRVANPSDRPRFIHSVKFHG